MYMQVNNKINEYTKYIMAFIDTEKAVQLNIETRV